MENGSRNLPLYATRALLFASSAYSAQFTDALQTAGLSCVAVSLLALSHGEAQCRRQMGARTMDLWSGALFGCSALKIYQVTSSFYLAPSLMESLDLIRRVTYWTAFGLGSSKGIWQFTTGLDEGGMESLYLRQLVATFFYSLFPNPSLLIPWRQRIRLVGTALYRHLCLPPAHPGERGSSESWILDTNVRAFQEEVNPGSFRAELARWLGTHPAKERVVELIRSTDATLLPLTDLSEMGLLASEAVESYLDEVSSTIVTITSSGTDDEVIAEIRGYYQNEESSYTLERVAELRKWYRSRSELSSRATQAMHRIGNGAEGRALELITKLSACRDNPLPDQNPSIPAMLETLSSRMAARSQPEEEEEFELYGYLAQLRAADYHRLHDELGFDQRTDELNGAMKACGLSSQKAFEEAKITPELEPDECVKRIIEKIRASRPQESSFKRSLESLSAAAARIGQADLATQTHHALSLLILLTPVLSDPKTYLIMVGIGLLAGRDYSRNNSTVFGLPIGEAFQVRGREFARHDFFGRLRLLYKEVFIVSLIDAIFMPRAIVQGGRLGLLAGWLLRR